jgi:hypothetical protein
VLELVHAGVTVMPVGAGNVATVGE